MEQTDGTKLVSSGIGKLAGVPAYVMPDMSDTLLGANVVCKLGNIMLVDDQKIICVGSDASTRALLSTFYDFIHQNKDIIKFTAYEENGYYKVLRSQIKLNNNKRWRNSFLVMKLYSFPTSTTLSGSSMKQWDMQTCAQCY